MRATFLVPLVAGSKVAGSDVNHLGVIIDHYKSPRPDRTGVDMSVLPVNVGPEMFEWVIRPSEHWLLEQKARRSQKAIDDWVHAVKMQVGLRAGRQWDFIVRAAEKDGLTIAEPQPVDEATAAHFDAVAG